MPISNGDTGYDSGNRASLRFLEGLSLIGNIHYIFPILHRLRLDRAKLFFHGSVWEEARQVIGPRIREYFQRDPRFRDRLRAFISSNGSCVSLEANVVGVGYRPSDRLPNYRPPYRTFKVALLPDVPRKAQNKLYMNILALVPQECVAHLETNIDNVMEELLVAMPNIELLYLVYATMSGGFLLPNPGRQNAHMLLPSLQ